MFHVIYHIVHKRVLCGLQHRDIMQTSGVLDMYIDLKTWLNVKTGHLRQKSEKNSRVSELTLVLHLAP